MFQTEIIKYIQSFETDLLTKMFLFFSTLGYEHFFLGFTVIFIFGIDFKKGLVLTHILITTGIVTGLLKQYFALPRPYHVDNNIKTLWNKAANNSKFSSGGSDSFLSLPDKNIITFYRNKTGTLFGLPSGHTSSAAVIWGSLIILYKNIWLRFIAIIMIIAIPFSRLYLGRHFLGDLLAGYLLGGLLLLFFYQIYYKNNFRRFSSRSIKYSKKFFFHLIYLFFTPLIIFVLFPAINTRLSGALLGINFLLVIFTAKGFPILYSGIGKRIISSLTALIFFSAVSFILFFIFDLMFEDSDIVKFAGTAFISGFGIWITVKVCSGLNLIYPDHYKD